MLGNGMRVTMVVRRRQCTVPPFSKRRRADARKRTGQRYAGYDTRLVSPNFPCKPNTAKAGARVSCFLSFANSGMSYRDQLADAPCTWRGGAGRARAAWPVALRPAPIR